VDPTIPGNLLTTAMAVMPHTDEERALEMALSLDVPFWPQLPNYSYYEDMYVQAAEKIENHWFDYLGEFTADKKEKMFAPRCTCLRQRKDKTHVLK